MHLSSEELARLELMFMAGQVCSDPAVLSNTDQMMDAMTHARKRIYKTLRNQQFLRNETQTEQHMVSEIEPSEVHETEPQIVRGAKPHITHTRDQDEPPEDWSVPRTLEQLIEIRRSLMRNEEPSL